MPTRKIHYIYIFSNPQNNYLGIMKNVEIPISIVECGFLSNPEEEKQLLEDSYQNRLAWGIYNGILDYFYTIGK